MPSIDSHPLKNAIAFVLHALDRNDSASQQVVHLAANNGELSLSAAGSRGCAQVRVRLREQVSPETFAANAFDLEQLAEALPSVHSQHLTFGRDTLQVDDSMRETRRVRRVPGFTIYTPAGWFETGCYRADSEAYEFPAHLITPAVIAVARIAGPYTRVRLGLGASPLVIEAARPDLGGIISAQFAIPSNAGA